MTHDTIAPPHGLAAQITAYHREAVRHRQEHGCGGYPFHDGQRLTELAAEHHAERILELGTAIGFSAFCLAAAGDAVHVDTVDRDAEHVALARDHLRRRGVEDRVTLHEGDFATVIATLQPGYDLVFVDGFDADPALLPRIDEIADAVIVSANLSWSATTRRYLQTLTELGWISARDGDIAISRRHADVPR